MSKFVLTFVHGTWGRGMIFPSGDAAWTTDESTLCRSLRDRLGPDAVFRRFRWSGRNSHTARLKASERLRDFLQEGLNDPPDATHIIVAHSHGGNVALRALGDHPNLREQINGVACLATPFIAAQYRNIGRDGWAILGRGTALALVFVLGGLVESLYFLFTHANVPKRILWMWVCVAVLGLVVSLVLLLRNRIREHASKLRRELSTPPLGRSQLLIIRSPADEASGIIGVFQFLSHATVRLFLFGESCYVSAEALVKKAPGKLLRIGIYWFALLIPFMVLLTFWDDTWSSLSVWLKILVFAGAEISAAVSYVAIMLVVFDGLERLFPRLFSWPKRFILLYAGSLLALLTWLMIPVLSMLLVLPFGWQVALANLLLDVTAETTPLGSWETHLIEPPSSEEIGGPVPPLMHKVYENPRVQRKLGEWIETRGSDAAKRM
jgi:hypothetical protein